MRFVIALAVVLATACGDNITPQSPGDANPPPPVDAGVDAAPATGACVDRPTDLFAPPPLTGTLPCELLPPGFGR